MIIHLWSSACLYFIIKLKIWFVILIDVQILSMTPVTYLLSNLLLGIGMARYLKKNEISADIKNKVVLQSQLWKQFFLIHYYFTQSVLGNIFKISFWCNATSIHDTELLWQKSALILWRKSNNVINFPLTAVQRLFPRTWRESNNIKMVPSMVQ